MSYFYWAIYVCSAMAMLILIFWPQLRRKVKQKMAVADIRLPHERYPRILNWRKGDTFHTRDHKYWPRFYAGHAKLLGLSEDGRVFLEDYERK